MNFEKILATFTSIKTWTQEGFDALGRDLEKHSEKTDSKISEIEKRLGEKLASYESRFDGLQEQLNEKNSKIRGLETLISSKNAECEQLKMEMDALKSVDFSSLVKSQIDPVCEDLASKIGDNSDKTSSKFSEVEKSTNEKISGLESHIKEISNELSDKNSQIVDLADKIRGKEAIVEQLKTEIESIKSKFADNGSEIEQLKSEIKHISVFDPSALDEYLLKGAGEKIVSGFINREIEKLPTPKGEKGDKGDQGKDGKSVSLDEILLEMKNEIARQVMKIDPPKDGKDAIELEIQPSVDFQKSYPRGIYACHKGGVIRSYKSTQEDHGWEVVLNGVAGVTQKQVDERTVEIVTEMTDGKKETAKFSYPAMIYRGIWKDETKYTRGDTVTFGGSLWHCDNPTEEEKPGTVNNSKCWTLCAKKGRDGGKF